MKYCYSHDEERFYGDFKTLEAALAEAFEDKDRDTAWIGTTDGTAKLSHYFRGAEDLLDGCSESAYDECGDVAEDWLSFLSPGTDETARENKAAKLVELEDAISKVLDEWAEKHGEHPEFWHVENIQKWNRTQAESVIRRAS